MDWLYAIHNSFELILQFLTGELYELMVQITSFLFIKASIAWLDMKLFIIEFSWDVSQDVITQLGLADAVESAFALLDSTIANFAGFLGIPEAINIILGAHLTKSVMRFFGF